MATKTLEEYLALPWTFFTEWYEDDGGYYACFVDELPGCLADGKTPEEALKNVKEAMASHLESMLDDDVEIPEPLNLANFKGLITYRTKPKTHYKVAKAAQRKRMSINKLIDEAVESYIKRA